MSNNKYKVLIIEDEQNIDNRAGDTHADTTERKIAFSAHIGYSHGGTGETQ